MKKRSSYLLLHGGLVEGMRGKADLFHRFLSREEKKIMEIIGEPRVKIYYFLFYIVELGL